jgi:hypothetical protein
MQVNDYPQTTLSSLLGFKDALLFTAMIIGGLVTAFCAGGMYVRMDAAGVVLAEARALHEQALEDEKQSRQILERLRALKQANHGSHDAGQVSSL